MNNSEINLKITEIKGYDYTIICNRIHVYEGKSTRNYVFDPINDPVQREPLMMELLEAGRPPSKSRFGTYFYSSTALLSKILGKNKHFGTSTCLAWIKMKESKDG